MVAACTPGVVSSVKEQETGTLIATSDTILSSAKEWLEVKKKKDKMLKLNKITDIYIYIYMN